VARNSGGEAVRSFLFGVALLDLLGDGAGGLHATFDEFVGVLVGVPHLAPGLLRESVAQRLAVRPDVDDVDVLGGGLEAVPEVRPHVRVAVYAPEFDEPRVDLFAHPLPAGVHEPPVVLLRPALFHPVVAHQQGALTHHLDRLRRRAEFGEGSTPGLEEGSSPTGCSPL